MHSCAVLLIAVDDECLVPEAVEDFLKPYEGGVWDWYSIGGRFKNHWTEEAKSREDAVAKELAEIPTVLPPIVSWKKYPKECRKIVQYMLDVRKQSLMRVVEQLRKDSLGNLQGLDDLFKALQGDGSLDSTVLYGLHRAVRVLRGQFSRDQYVYDVDECSAGFSSIRLDMLDKEPDRFFLVTVDLHN